MKTSKPILNANLGEFINEIVEAVKQGWEIDPQNPPTLYGYLYECHVLRDESIVDEVKPTRAEILANARKAKAQKATAEQVEPAEEAPAE